LPDASDYQVYGLRIRSEIPLPELFGAKDEGDPDVTIRRGKLPAAGTAAGIQGEGDALLLTVPDVARYRIEAGRTIIVDPEPDVPERNLRLFLLGSAFGALLHQRGLLPLHANAVEIDGRAVAFMGESGAGKSTIAAWFHDRGFRVIADDVCVVQFDDEGRVLACPGLPRLRLWVEALELMGRAASGFHPSYVGETEFDKFDVPIEPELATRSAIPLLAAYVLERADELSIEPLSGVEAAEAVFANTYRGSYVSATKGHRDHWNSAVRLVRSTPIFRAGRKWNLAELDGQCSLLLEHVRGIANQPQNRERSR
jgi:hypothetical protein